MDFDIVIQVIAIIFIVGAMYGIIIVVTKYSRDMTTVEKKQHKNDSTLIKLREDLKTQKERVQELQQQIEPLKEEEVALQAYMSKLQDVLTMAQGREKSKEIEQRKEDDF